MGALETTVGGVGYSHYRENKKRKAKKLTKEQRKGQEIISALTPKKKAA